MCCWTVAMPQPAHIQSAAPPMIFLLGESFIKKIERLRRHFNSLVSTTSIVVYRCTRDAQTRIELNGISQEAHFSFEAFRFVEHKNLTISTFYLHCATRLCENSTCAAALPVTNHAYMMP